MTTDSMKALVEEGRAYAGDDQYGGALLLRELSNALQEAAERLDTTDQYLQEHFAIDRETRYQHASATLDRIRKVIQA